MAFSDSRRRPVTLCATTALELLGYPVVEAASLLHVPVTHRGDSGTTRQVSPYVNGQAVLRMVADLSGQVLMNGDGRVPMLPGGLRHWNAPGAESAGSDVGRAEGPPQPTAAQVSVRLEDGTELARPGATGPAGQDALVRGKRREDAVRRQGYGMARWIWADLFNRPRFVALLEQHGVPRT